jgi:malonate decarboxylase beta subunit
MNHMNRIPYHELEARERIAQVTDSFSEILPPPDRVMSPYLPELGIPVSFDDGLIIGKATVDGKPAYLAAQVGQFVGGAVGEVHSAKLIGLLKAAARDGLPCVILVESGGVRLHEGSAGEIGISEAIRAVFACRQAGVPVIAVIGSDIGAYGGMGILVSCCDTRILTEHGRIGISGPIVIEKWMGKEAYDSSNRALVWKTSGGKTRYLLGDADMLCGESATEVKTAIAEALAQSGKTVNLESATAKHKKLAARLEKFAHLEHPDDLWHACGVKDVRVASTDTAPEFLASLPS